MDVRYFTLRAYLFDREYDHHATFKLSELAMLWRYTNKNVKRILHKYEDMMLIDYRPGKGRGNTSEIFFKNTFQTDLDSYIKTCIKENNLNKVAELLRLPIPKNWITQSSSIIRELFSDHHNQPTKDILHVFVTRDILTLDPLETVVTFEAHLIEQLGDSLVKYDATCDKIIPHLAHHFDVDESQLKWTFHLRKGIRFHHQEVLKSQDVAATIQRVKSSSSAFSWLAEDIEKVECPNTYKVVVHLKKPNPFILHYLASSNFCILPKNISFDEHQWIGTGPFRLKVKTNHKLVLEAFDFYFKERPLLDEIHFYKVSTNTLKLINYSIDGNDEAETQEQLQETEAGFRFLIFNHNKESIVRRRTFREAIYHLLDIKKMALDLSWMEWVEASSFIPHRSTHLKKDSSKVPDLLKEAGYSGESLHLFHLSFQKATEEAQWFQQEAQQYGIQIECHPFTLEEFYAKTFDHQADFIFMGEVSSLDSHLSFLGAFYNKSLLFRRMFHQDHLAWIETKLETFKQQPTWTLREQIITDIEAFIRANHLLIFQHHPTKIKSFHPMIKDTRFQSFGHFDFKRMWLPS